MDLKREFRGLRDLTHPNIVTLGELVEDGGHWFFTMELVDGTDFITHVRPGSEAPGVQASPSSAETNDATSTAQISAIVDDGGASAAVTRSALAGLDEARLRSALLQLAEALCAVHAAGLVHRDIKPSNILVDRNDRVVLLDFGIAQVIDRSVAGEASRSRRAPMSHVHGTALYMAPEQIAGTTGVEVDWYAFGMVLYHALLGRPPLTGSQSHILSHKLQFDLEPPRTWDPGIPEDLDALCVDLLRRNPADRPRGPEVVTRLRGVAGMRNEVGSLSASRNAQPFVGRSAEIESLVATFRTVAEGAQPAVVIEGESGVGKSALLQQAVQRFLDERPGVCVLRGRCHEREAVPFKAFDSVVDQLVTLLVEDVDLQRARPAAAQTQLLAQLFPTSAQLADPGQAQRRPQVIDAPEMRRRAFDALRTLFAQVTSIRPVLVLIDDIHWADPDSILLLRELLKPPALPRLLLVCTARPLASTPSMVSVASIEAALGSSRRALRLQPLRHDEALELARSFGARALPSDTGAHRIAEESGGHPLYLLELVRHAQQHGVVREAVQLDDALWTRVLGLEREAQEVLRVVSVGGRPLPNEALRVATGLGHEPFARAVSTLRREHFVRGDGLRRKDALEPYHDRIREVVVARIAEIDRTALHRKLAESLEGVDGADPETLAIHWDAAGERARAANHALQAAREAEAALAFDRAARLYRFSLDRVPGTSEDERRALRLQLAEALANAGRSSEAAECFQAAAEGARAPQAQTLQRMAGEKFMQSVISIEAYRRSRRRSRAPACAGAKARSKRCCRWGTSVRGCRCVGCRTRSGLRRRSLQSSCRGWTPRTAPRWRSRCSTLCAHLNTGAGSFCARSTRVSHDGSRARCRSSTPTCG